jgi:molecular chaperone HtpG
MLDHEPIFGKNVIETLSEGMYDNPLFLFREYVQNAADAIDAAVRADVLKPDEGQIEIAIDRDKRIITFEDNGTGIPHEAVTSMLANIGDSQKDRRTDKGFRGIGRLGGLGYCQKVRFETSARGEKIKSVLEWDARNLHDILANKEEKIHAGQLIKRITSTWEEACPENEHFFKVTLKDVNKQSTELLDVHEVRKYLAMVAPVPFDYAKFPFIKKIEKFIADKQLPNLHEYRLSLNGDEVCKGYETPLAIDDGKQIEILDVECKTVLANGIPVGWYWFCVSKFEGVLPKKCWQRNIRLRKANIQIGEADCLTNHPKRGETLWREDRGNNYFVGEIHVLDENLIPNSRRDYFNQDEACRRFEAALHAEFLNLHYLYHDASTIRSASQAIQEAELAKKEFDAKERQGGFYDKSVRDKEAEKVAFAVQKASNAQRTIEKIESKITPLQLNESTENVTISSVATVFESYKKEIPATIRTFEPQKRPQQGYAKNDIKKSTKNVLDLVFEVLNKMLPEEEATQIREAILKKISRQ